LILFKKQNLLVKLLECAKTILGICGVIVGHPLDTMKVRQQTLGTTMLVAVRRTFKYERIRGFFKGMLFPLLAVGPSNAVFFGVYGNVINVMQQTSKRNHDISITDQVAIRRVYVAGITLISPKILVPEGTTHL
jgi:hypothetical protein